MIVRLHRVDFKLINKDNLPLVGVPIGPGPELGGIVAGPEDPKGKACGMEVGGACDVTPNCGSGCRTCANGSALAPPGD